jgi:SOS-response transcriptional repressor LexA
MTGITHRQRQALLWLVAYKAAHRRFPPFKEVMAGLGYQSTGAVHRVLSQLVQRGFLAHYARAYRLLPAAFAAAPPSGMDHRTTIEVNGAPCAVYVVKAGGR